MSLFCFSSCSFLSTGALTSLSTPISPSPVCFLFTRQQRHRTYHAFSLFLPTAEMRDLNSTQKLYLCLTPILNSPHLPPFLLCSSSVVSSSSSSSSASFDSSNCSLLLLAQTQSITQQGASLTFPSNVNIPF